MRAGWTKAGLWALFLGGVACTPPLTEVTTMDDATGATGTPTELTSSNVSEHPNPTGEPATGAADGTGGSASSASSGSPLDGSTGGPSDGSTGGSTMQGTMGSTDSTGSMGEGVCGDGNQDPGEACDDGDEDDLDGCLGDCRLGPLGFDFGPPTVLEQYGNTSGGNAFNDACPANEVLIGLRGSTVDWVTQMRAVCGALQLVDPSTIALSLTESMVFPLRGLTPGPTYNATCPAGSAVVGFHGASGLLVDSITLSCAPLVLMDDGVTLSLGVGTPSDLNPFGGLGGDPFPQTDCPPGEVAKVANIRAGDGIDAFGITCRPVSLMY